MQKTRIILALFALVFIQGNAAFSAEDGMKELARGDVLATREEFGEAVAKYNQAININPKLPQAYAHRAGALVQMGKFQEALADCNKAIKLEPKYVRAIVLRGLIYKQLGKPRKELQDMRLAKKLINADGNKS